MDYTAEQRMQFPALNGETVMTMHVRICEKYGHAIHRVKGILQPHCPRCGKHVW